MAYGLLEKHNLDGYYDSEKEAVYATRGMTLHDLIPYKEKFIRSPIGDVKVPTAFKFGDFMSQETHTHLLHFAVDYVNNLIELYTNQPWKES